MWVCRKCHQPATHGGRICRACGGILEQVPDEPPVADDERVPDEGGVSASGLPSGTTTVDAEADAPAAEGGPAPNDRPAAAQWRCPRCGELVPGNLDVCWKCMTFRDDEQAPDASRLVPGGSENDRETGPAFGESEAVGGEDAMQKIAGCPRCGSHRIIPDVTVLDQGDHSDGTLKTVVAGNPDALIFKHRLYGEIKADICGDCGHVELRVANPAELYDRYRESAEP